MSKNTGAMRRVLAFAAGTMLTGGLLTAVTSAAQATITAEPIGAANANSASCTPVGQAGSNTELHLFSINDFHGRLNNNTVQFAGVIEGLKAKYGAQKSLTLSSGDNIGASLFTSSLQYDAPTIAVLNALGVKAATMGNHEFDKGFFPGSGQPGLDFTTRVLKGETTGVGADHPAVKADFAYLAANAYKAGTKEQIVPGHVIIEQDGLKIAVIGAVTQDTPNLVSKGALAGIDFGNPVTAVNEEVAKIKAAGGADVYVADYHDGAGAGTPDGVTLQQEITASPTFGEIVTKTDPAVSAIFTAHTHKLYVWDAPNGATTRPVVQTQSYGAYVGNVCLSVNKATHKVTGRWAENVAVPATPKDATAAAAADKAITDAFPAAAKVKKIVDDATTVAKTAGEKVVGRINGDFTRASEKGTFDDKNKYSAPGYGNRAMGSSLGNLVTTALQDRLQTPGAEPIVTLANPGGIRDDVLFGNNGNVTFAAANAVLPFLNNLWTLDLTGANLKNVLEQQWQTNQDGTSTGSYLQLAMSDNLRYTYDATKPQGQHILQVWVNGKPLDAAKKYRVGTFNFLAQGGDNFWEFLKATGVKDTGLVDRDAWIAYFDAYLHEGLTPDFSQRAFQAKALIPATAAQSATVSFNLSDLQMRSSGSSLVKELSVRLGDTEVAKVPVTPNAAASGVAPENPANDAKITFTVPANFKVGDSTLNLENTDHNCLSNCTVLSVPFAVTAKVGTPPGKPPVKAPPVYSYPFTDALYVVEGTGDATRARKITFAEWKAWGFPKPVAAPVAYVKYAWSNSVSAVTFWNAAPASWLWTPLNLDQWRAAGQPSPSTAGWIQGTTLKKFGTSDELFATDNLVTHKINLDEWKAMNYASFVNVSNEGYGRMPWSDVVIHLTDLAQSRGARVTPAEWVAAALPTPKIIYRSADGEFVKSAGNDQVFYTDASLGINRVYVSLENWRAAGYPPVKTQ